MPNLYRFESNLSNLLDSIPEDSIVSRTIHNDEQIKIILFGFAPNQELSEHTASMPAIIEILYGEFQIQLGEDLIEAEAGAWIHMPANLTHSLVAKSKAKMLLTLLKVKTE
jgi:quercetin dioxygenase-like cupin family protein